MEEINYYVRAENDYLFLKMNYENNVVGDAMCYISQNTCERYLKHIIDIFYSDDAAAVMRTHSLRVLAKFMQKEFPEFGVDWSTVLLAEGYYFSAMYPGDDAIIVDKEDVDNCWNAVIETRRAVQEFIKEHTASKVDITKDPEVLQQLHLFKE